MFQNSFHISKGSIISRSFFPLRFALSLIEFLRCLRLNKGLRRGLKSDNVTRLDWGVFLT